MKGNNGMCLIWFFINVERKTFVLTELLLETLGYVMSRRDSSVGVLIIQRKTKCLNVV